MTRKPPTQPAYLFVYGTLRLDTPPNNRATEALDQHTQQAGKGWIRGKLFDLGSFPAARPAADSWVTGRLYRIKDPEQLFEVLDPREGHRQEANGLFSRDKVSVFRGDGATVKAWIYWWNRDTHDGPEIRSGDGRHYQRKEQSGR